MDRTYLNIPVNTAIFTVITRSGGTCTIKELVPKVLALVPGANRADISRCSRALRAGGDITSPVRGTWALTDEGRRVCSWIGVK